MERLNSWRMKRLTTLKRCWCVVVSVFTNIQTAVDDGWTAPLGHFAFSALSMNSEACQLFSTALHEAWQAALQEITILFWVTGSSDSVTPDHLCPRGVCTVQWQQKSTIFPQLDFLNLTGCYHLSFVRQWTAQVISTQTPGQEGLWFEP